MNVCAVVVVDEEGKIAKMEVFAATAFAIMGRVQQAMKRAGIPKEDISAFLNEAMSGDYHHLLRVACQYVEVL